MKKIFFCFLFLILFLNPVYAEKLFSVTDDAIYVTNDLGQSWKSIYIEAIGFAHYTDMCFLKPSRTMYLSTTNGILKSFDGGTKWSKIHFGSDTVFRTIKSSLDGADVIYALSDTGLYLSTNGGNNWKSLALPSTQIFFVAPFYNSGVIYIAGNEGIYVSRNGGKDWKRIGVKKILSSNISCISVNPSNTSQMYVATSKGLFYTPDGGATWKDRTISRNVNIVTQKVIWASDNTSLLYVLDGDVKEEGRYYLRVSSDGGKRWTLIGEQDEITLFAINPSNSSFVCFFGNEPVMYGTEEGTKASFVHFSSNRGKDWKKVRNIVTFYGIKHLYVRPW